MENVQEVGIAKCNVCHKEFTLDKSIHYIARENTKSGIAIAISSQEERWFDAFDCPHCGCQNVMQDRRRRFTSALSIGTIMDDEPIGKPIDELVFVEVSDVIKQVDRCRQCKDCFADGDMEPCTSCIELGGTVDNFHPIDGYHPTEDTTDEN